MYRKLVLHLYLEGLIALRLRAWFEVMSSVWFRLLCSVLQRVAVYCSVLQCVAVCCSVLQCVAKGLLSKGYCLAFGLG